MLAKKEGFDVVLIDTAEDYIISSVNGGTIKNEARY